MQDRHHWEPLTSPEDTHIPVTHVTGHQTSILQHPFLWCHHWVPQCSCSVQVSWKVSEAQGCADEGFKAYSFLPRSAQQGNLFRSLVCPDTAINSCAPQACLLLGLSLPSGPPTTDNVRLSPSFSLQSSSIGSFFNNPFSPTLSLCNPLISTTVQFLRLSCEFF